MQNYLPTLKQADAPKYNLLVKQIKDLKSGAVLRDQACGLIKVILKDRPDLFGLVEQWSSPAGAAGAHRPAVASVGAGAATAPQAFPPSPMNATVFTPPRGQGVPQAGGSSRALGAAFSLSTGQVKPPPTAAGFASAPPAPVLSAGFSSMKPPSKAAGFASAPPASVSSLGSSGGAKEPSAGTGREAPSFISEGSQASMMSLPSAWSQAGGGGVGGASAMSQSPSIMSMSRSSASQPLGGAWGSEGAGGEDADTFEGLGPLEEKEVGKLTAKLRALKMPAVPLGGGSTKEQEEKSKEEWLR